MPVGKKIAKSIADVLLNYIDGDDADRMLYDILNIKGLTKSPKVSLERIREAVDYMDGSDSNSEEKK